MTRFPLAAVLTLLATPLSAEGTILVAPVYSQLVAVATPPGFTAGYEAETAGSYILELVPAGETVATWTQMITVTGGKGAAARVSVIDAATSIGQGYQTACPDSFSARSLPGPMIKGAVEAFSGYLACGTANGQSWLMVFIVVKGREDIYTVQWAERGPPQPGPIVPDAARWKPRSDALALTRICDRIGGEAAPYPSCTE